ncbi:MAG: hypothetical protein WC238_01005 [Parcubacteria group bacterium]|jgi:hypothetical protein
MINSKVCKPGELIPLKEITCRIKGRAAVVKFWTLDSVFVEAGSCGELKINKIVELVIKEKHRRDLVRVKAKIKRGGSPKVFRVAIDMTKNIWALTRIQEMQKRMREHTKRRA